MENIVLKGKVDAKKEGLEKTKHQFMFNAVVNRLTIGKGARSSQL